MGAATAREIAEYLEADSVGEDGAGAVIRRVSSIQDADGESLIFAMDGANLESALASSAGLILAPLGSPEAVRVVRVKDPRLAFARVYRRWFAPGGLHGVHETAILEAGAALGPGCEIAAGAYVASGVTIGSECILGPRVTVLAGTTLGNRVKVQAGSVLGSAGFGYARGSDGYVAFPQIGTLWIGDDVEIGANCTIDRGALGETRIGRGTKIDNLVHIAHNCRIGEDVILAAQVGIAGSTVIEDGAMLGGQVGLGENVTIGRGVLLGGQAGVASGKKLRGAGEVFWGTPARPLKNFLKDLARLRKL